jgi:hypothetical protein
MVIKLTSNNKLLKNIAVNTGSTITGIHSNNYYLKSISENTGSETEDMVKSNNQYLKEIALNTGSELDGSIKTNNAYLREIAVNVGSEVSDNVQSDHYYLEKIVDGNFNTNKIEFTINPSVIIEGGKVNLQAKVIKEGEILSNTRVNFYKEEQ